MRSSGQCLVLDAVFGEDESDFHTEQAHITINIFRKFAIALHKKYLTKIGEWLCQ